MPDDLSDPPTGTPAALIDAGLALFGHKGYDATSTRELAERASTNVASIAYHFGGKQGLLIACGEEVARRMLAVVGHPASAPAPLDPATATARLETMTRAVIAFLTGSHRADDMVAFLLREITAPGPVFERLYPLMLEPKHRELCALWAAATGQDPEAERVRLGVFAFLGQILYFRIGREIVSRRMGWVDDTPERVTAVSELLVANLHALLSAGRQA